METTDVVGISQIADRCGVTDTAVRAWQQRFDDWPDPAGHTSRKTGGPGSSPWWLWDDIEDFLGRHPGIGRRA